MGALDAAVRQGKALYVGISSYGPEKTKEAAAILKRLGTPCLIHQPSYSMLNRWVEDGLLDGLEGRSEERRVGKGWVRTCRSRRSTYHVNKNHKKTQEDEK